MTGPPRLPGLDPSWSRTVQTIDADGETQSWHVLDSDPGAAPGRPTLLCVHGNPTWSYLWRRLIANPPSGWRVVAPDQLGMGYSRATTAPRTLAQRVRDLGDLTDALHIDGPVITVAHDWGGIIALGWAMEHRNQLRGIVLANTAVSQPSDSRPPALIRLAHARALREIVCARTPLFVRAATALSRPALPRDVRAAFAAPYRGTKARRAVADFVADIPFADGHRSHRALSAINERIDDLDVPALLLWGPRDPVFGEQYLRDLRARLPRAAVHRYEGASHLLPEDAPRYAADIAAWVGDLSDRPLPPAAGASSVESRDEPQAEPAPPLWQHLVDRAAATGDQIAAAEVGGGAITWSDLDARVRATAAGLIGAGVQRGDRIAMLVPPSIELTVAVYAAWRAGASIVVADKGLGLRGMGRALRSADPQYVIGIGQGLAAAAALRVPGIRLLAGSAPAAARRALHVHSTLSALAMAGDASHRALGNSAGDAEAAVVFTSGATGPAKGVVYLHRQVAAQIRTLQDVYGLTGDDRLVAAFAPFALYGPALGLGSAVPDTDVTAPGTLTASALADAVRAIDATIVFASPAALRNVTATASGLTAPQREALAGIRLLMSAGAPVPAALLRAMAAVTPNAALHTPYGMTEVLPVTDVSLEQIEQAGPGDGICVGRPVAGVEVQIDLVDDLGQIHSAITAASGVTGEICVRAEHGKSRYDALWATDRASSAKDRWHRTGDVGFLDEQGRLWVQGRIQHLITTAGGIVTPVGLEQLVEALPGVRAAAAVGVGPVGTQQVVIVVVPSAGQPRGRSPVAGLAFADVIRAAVTVPVAAVLSTRALPVDIRHQSKVDRVALAAWAAKVLAGRA